MWSTQHIDPDTKLCWKESGGAQTGSDAIGDETPIVLLHGFAGQAEDYIAVADRLASSGRILAFDLPAHGGSRDCTVPGHPKAASEAILTALKNTGVETFHLCGFSMGGAIACLMAMSAPERVRSLTLVAPGGFGPEIGAEILDKLGGAQSETELAMAIQMMAGPDFDLPVSIIQRTVEQRRDPRLAEAQRLLGERLFKGGVQGMIPRAMLENVRCPVEIVWGTGDPIVPFQQSENRPEAFRLTALPGAGHMLLAQAPEAVAAAIGRAKREAGTTA
ncbi:alpha/beta fold hydrolase [Oricola sp.]|uniref:alpha/beta fold hydrolase n=1 Tax=Oricola sp. TaxID=1979950 RepID=UPI003BAD0965